MELRGMDILQDAHQFDLGAKRVPRGGKGLPTTIICPGPCGLNVTIGAGYVMRIPNPEAKINHCHEIIDPDDTADHYGNGDEPRIIKRGGSRK